MSTDYNYDDSGQFFPYFVLTVVGLVTVPLTWHTFKPSKELENTAARVSSDYKPTHANLIDNQKRMQKRRERKLKRMMFSVTGWLVMAYMVYLMAVTARTIPKIWDPYDVLGVSRSASEKQIKSHYRKLSLTQHPDKVTPDPAKNRTSESINEHWVEITKAFKALTDEEVRNNYLQYGHPDGKQSFSMGIALPQFIVQEGNGKYTLMFYLALLGIFLPYLAGRWWYGTQKKTKDGILVTSAGKLFQAYLDDLKERDIIANLSVGDEYKDILIDAKGDNGLTKIEKAIIGKDSMLLEAKDAEKLQSMDEQIQRKVLGLLWAYLHRKGLGDEALDSDKYAVAPVAFQLNDVHAVFAQAFMHMKPLLASYRVSQHLIQAIPPGGSPLLQLPHFSEKVVKAVEGNSRDHLTVQEFVRIPADRRKKMVTGPGLLSDVQYQTAMKIAYQLPAVQIEHAFFKVPHEKFITPGSLVHFIVKLRFVPPGSKNVPPAEKKELDDPKQKEDEQDNEAKRFGPTLAHAPFYARDHSPRWHLFLGDGKMSRVVVPPFTYSTFDREIVDATGEPTFNVQTMRMQFVAPAHPGKYTFIMYLINDSYLGLDEKMFVTLNVDDASKVAEVEEDEISEDDTPSKEGKKIPRKPVPEDASSSGESNTDEEESDFTSETDTDTSSDED